MDDILTFFVLYFHSVLVIRNGIQDSLKLVGLITILVVLGKRLFSSCFIYKYIYMIKDYNYVVPVPLVLI